MRARARWLLWCDVCRDKLEFGCEWHDAVDQARAKGWTISELRGDASDDRCPTCREVVRG